MTQPIVQPAAAVAATGQASGSANVLTTRGYALRGVLRWPSWREPDATTPESRIGETGEVQNHWHVQPGTLNAAVSPPTYVGERITPARHRYDGRHEGAPLAFVDVDLFHAADGIDLDDYALMRPFYSAAPDGSDPSAPGCGTGVPEIGGDPRLLAAYVGTATTDANGRFAFEGLASGRYALHLRGRFSFVDVPHPGGDVAGAPAHQHNGVDAGALSARQGAHRHHAPVTLQGADVEVAVFGLPLVSAQCAGQWRACVEQIRRAFAVSAEAAAAAMRATAVLDLRAMERWQCAGSERLVVAGDASSEVLLQHTLLLGPGDTLTMAYDHVFWRFERATSTTKTPAPFVPLGEAGFFAGASRLHHAESKDAYGRSALRAVEPSLEGRDVRELKVRLVLWGDAARYVDLTHDRFDRALRDALLRFKRSENLVRGPSSVVVSILDDETYRALDRLVPSLPVSAMACTSDPRAGMNGVSLLPPDGASRINFFAAENVRMRVAPGRALCAHSGYRTLAYNRKVYLDNHNLRWRVASNAPQQPPIQRPAFPPSVIGGVTNADGTAHAAGDAVTQATMQAGNVHRWDEPRGTFRSNQPQGQGDHWAPDFSNHTTGRALDFCLDRDHHAANHGTAPGTAHAQVQRDTDAITLFGAHRGAHAPPRMWLEPGFPAVGWGTKTWIHMDVGDLHPAGLAGAALVAWMTEHHEYVLTEEDMRGPRWDATLVVRGRVTRGGQPLQGALVELLDAGARVTQAVSDANGDYTLRATGRDAHAGGYEARVSFTPTYYRWPRPPATITGAPVPVAFAYPGEEVVVDLVLPP